METIRLVGGPGDGERFEWRGGDVLEYSGRQKAPEFLAVGEEPSALKDYVKYRRSIVSRSLFVFQP